MTTLANRFPGAKPGEFSEYWREEQAKDDKRRKEDEEVLGPSRDS